MWQVCAAAMLFKRAISKQHAGDRVRCRRHTGGPGGAGAGAGALPCPPRCPALPSHLNAAGAPVQDAHDLSRLAVQVEGVVQVQQVAEHVQGDGAEGGLGRGGIGQHIT